MRTDLDEVVARVKAAKEKSVESFGPNADLPPFVIASREGRVRMEVTAGKVDRDLGLSIARALISGLGADEIVFATDALAATAALNPLTGKEWGHGEMSMLREKRPDLAAGLLVEAMQIVAIGRDHDWASAMMPYKVDLPSRTLQWLEEQRMERSELETGHDVAIEGLVPDVLRSFFEEPTLLDSLDKHLSTFGLDRRDFALTPKQERLHTDLAIAKFLGEQGNLVALVPWDVEEEAIVAESHQAWLQERAGHDARAARRRQERENRKKGKG